MHVPGHCGLPGNEAADRQAARGGTLPQHQAAIDLPSAQSTIRRTVRHDILREYRRTVSRPGGSESARKFFAHATPVTLEPNMDRSLQSAIRRGRCNHWIGCAAYREDIRLQADANCRDCGETPDDVDHVLLHCPRWTYQRIHHLGRADPSLKDALNNPQALGGFLRATGRISAA